MKKTKLSNVFHLAFCIAILALATPPSVNSFDTIKNGDTELTVWGFLRNTTGIFTSTQAYSVSGNQLATEATTLRTYVDLKKGEQWRFFLDGQFVYEPRYPVEQGADSSYYKLEAHPVRTNGMEYSEYNNINDVVREVFAEWKPTKTIDIKFGRQIAIWGEALTDRVGDVIHPNDNRFTFAFANLEDTRTPEWMIRGLNDIPALNSSFEWIIDPLLTGDQWRVNQNGAYFNQYGDGAAGQRFGVNPEVRVMPPYSVGNPANPASVVGWPVSSTFVYKYGAWIPLLGIPNIDVRYPTDTRYGFRTTTTAGGYTFGMIYWHTQNYDPLVARGANIPTSSLPIQNWTLSYFDYDILGAYMNKQLPCPGVVRAEAIYSPNKPFNSFNMGPGEDGIVRRDYVKYMVAYDLNSYFYFPWHNTAPFDVTLEHVGEWVPNASDLQWGGGVWNTKQPVWHGSFGTRISTNWCYNRIATEMIFSYDPFGNSGLFMPAITWNPANFNQRFSAQLKYIKIYGDNNYEGLGIFNGKDTVVLTTQFNF